MKNKAKYFLVLFSFVLCAFCFLSNSSTAPQSKEELGKLLFFDPILSQDKSISCSSCHKPEFAFADTVAFSDGVGGNLTSRNVPSVMNVTDRSSFFWDGRANTLQEQVIFPIENEHEMNLPMNEALSRLNSSEEYISYFKKLYAASPSKDNVCDAIAAFEKTLETSNTPFDRYAKGDENAISEKAKRGQQVFNDKGCFDCHFSPDFTGDEFKNIGLYNGNKLNDVGRFKITGRYDDIGKFKVPGLRNVAVTAPYMHNGMFRTLRQVIEYYAQPEQVVKVRNNTDSLVENGLQLNEQEIQELEAFLKTLTDDRFAKK